MFWNDVRAVNHKVGGMKGVVWRVVFPLHNVGFGEKIFDRQMMMFIVHPRSMVVASMTGRVLR